MTRSKKVALIISKYYFSDKVLIGLKYFFNWDITIIDFKKDKEEGLKRFKKEFPQEKYIFFKNRNNYISFFKDNKFDFVISLNESLRQINISKRLGYIKCLIILQAVNINSGQRFAFFKAWKRMIFKAVNDSSFIKILYLPYQTLELLSIKAKGLDNYRKKNKYYDLYLCWNSAHSKYVSDFRLRMINHPFHLLCAEEFIPHDLSFNILIAYNGDLSTKSLKLRMQYEAFIQSIIDYYGSNFNICLKLHPRLNTFENDKFKGHFEIRAEQLTINEMKNYDIFIGEDTYLGIEFFFIGSLIICYGSIDNTTSNLDYNDGWFLSSNEAIKKIDYTIKHWKEFQLQRNEFFESMIKNNKWPSEIL